MGESLPGSAAPGLVSGWSAVGGLGSSGAGFVGVSVWLYLYGDAGAQVIESSGPAWTAWVAASDADETALSALLDELSETGSLIGVSVEGVPADALDPSAVAAAIGRVASDSRGWHGALVRGVDTVAGRSMSLAWWTRFDAGGSVADPEREWATGHS